MKTMSGDLRISKPDREKRRREIASAELWRMREEEEKLRRLQGRGTKMLSLTG